MKGTQSFWFFRFFFIRFPRPRHHSHPEKQHRQNAESWPARVCLTKGALPYLEFVNLLFFPSCMLLCLKLLHLFINHQYRILFSQKENSSWMQLQQYCSMDCVIHYSESQHGIQNLFITYIDNKSCLKIFLFFIVQHQCISVRFNTWYDLILLSTWIMELGFKSANNLLNQQTTWLENVR